MTMGKEKRKRMVFSGIFVSGFVLMFFAYRAANKNFQQTAKYRASQVIANVVRRPNAFKDVPKPAKYASFTRENSIKSHFLPLLRKGAETVTFQIAFNLTANDSSKVTLRKYGEFIWAIEDVEVNKIPVDCVDLRIKLDITKICVYKRENDLFVSGSIRNNGNWEGINLQDLAAALHGKPDMVFLDIGCNLGVFTTYTMLFGNPTVCIDPLLANLQVMKKTLKLTNDDKNVILLWNAISEKHEKVTLSQGQENNIGSTHVHKLNETSNIQTVVNYVTQTILLDDFQDILANKRVFIKMDIESYEWRALAGGENFFKKANVCYVMMEIVTHKMRDTGTKIYNFLTSFGLYPFSDVAMKNSLHILEIRNWPVDVIFVKNTTECQLM